MKYKYWLVGGEIGRGNKFVKDFQERGYWVAYKDDQGNIIDEIKKGTIKKNDRIALKTRVVRHSSIIIKAIGIVNEVFVNEMVIVNWVCKGLDRKIGHLYQHKIHNITTKTSLIKEIFYL